MCIVRQVISNVNNYKVEDIRFLNKNLFAFTVYA